MKKLILLIIMFQTITAYTQTEKGNFMLSGSTSFVFGKTNFKPMLNGKVDDEFSQITLQITPSVGFFIIDNLAIALPLNISKVKFQGEDNEDEYSKLNTMIFLEPVYFFELAENLKVIAQMGLGYASLKEKELPETSNSDKIILRGPAFNFGAGFSYFVNNTIALNFGISYTNSSLKLKESQEKLKQSTILTNFGISIFLSKNRE